MSLSMYYGGIFYGIQREIFPPDEGMHVSAQSSCFYNVHTVHEK